MVLMALLFSFNVKLLYMSEEGLQSQSVSFISHVPKKTVQLYMSSEGGAYDVLYDKAYIKTAGICQSILLEVVF